MCYFHSIIEKYPGPPFSEMVNCTRENRTTFDCYPSVAAAALFTQKVVSMRSPFLASTFGIMSKTGVSAFV
jgi:hypothetical protein